MNEKELKNNINALRHEIDQRNKRIRELYREINFHKRDADQLRIKRDETTERANKLGEEAKIFIANRDKLNEKISKLKERRNSIITEIKNFTREIKENKNLRDELNKDSRGTNELLKDIYEKNLKILLNDDIPLKDEIKLFDKVFEIKERLKVAKKADSLHKKILNKYDHIQKLKTELNQIREEIQNIARTGSGTKGKSVGRIKILLRQKKNYTQRRG